MALTTFKYIFVTSYTFCGEEKQYQLYAIAVADPELLNAGRERQWVYQPSCHLSQMRIMNYTRLIQEKATYWNKFRDQ